MKALLLWLAIVTFISAESEVSAQQKDTQGSNPSTSAPQSSPTPASQDLPPDSPKTLEDTISASEDDDPPRRKLIRWNEYQGPHFTFQFGAGILFDSGAFAQDQGSKRQIAMYPGHKVRARHNWLVLGFNLNHLNER
jgi:hypothetical protein